MTHKLSILLVEDEKNICDFISTSLSAQDYRISTAHTGKEALPIITSQCPDLILLDLGLPDMDGMEIIRQVRTWSSVPIIVLSARTQEQEKVRALDLGADLGLGAGADDAGVVQPAHDGAAEQAGGPGQRNPVAVHGQVDDVAGVIEIFLQPHAHAAEMDEHELAGGPQGV